MIDLYYWTTPNGHKITLFLEESGLPYRVVPVNIGRGEQFNPEFLRISPNNRIPAIVDNAPADGGEALTVFESGAILLYLADKIRRFIPQDMRGRNLVLQWLFWQMGGLGPMAGQNHHFVQYAAIRRVEPTACRRPGFYRWRIFDRRHGLLSVGRSASATATNTGALCPSVAVVRAAAATPGDHKGLRPGQGNQYRAGRR